MFGAQNFRRPPCADSSVAKLSDGGHNRRFSDDGNRRFLNPYCDAQFNCPDAAFIPNQRVNVFFGLRRRCLGWSTPVGTVTSVLFTALKMRDRGSNWANICGILAKHASLTSMNLWLKISAVRNSITCIYPVRMIKISTILHCYSEQSNSAGRC